MTCPEHPRHQPVFQPAARLADAHVDAVEIFICIGNFAADKLIGGGGINADLAEVMFESRNVLVTGGQIVDDFGAWERHVYMIDMWNGLEGDYSGDGVVDQADRSEERRVGKEGRSRWSPDH